MATKTATIPSGLETSTRSSLKSCARCPYNSCICGLSKGSLVTVNGSVISQTGSDMALVSHQQCVPVLNGTSKLGRVHAVLSLTNNSNAILAAASPHYNPPVSPQEFQPDRPIGYGAFGVVW